MAITMANTIQEERLRWVVPIVHQEVRLVEAAKLCPYGKRTLERWVAAYKRGGAEALEPRSTQPSTQGRDHCFAAEDWIMCPETALEAEETRGDRPSTNDWEDTARRRSRTKVSQEESEVHVHQG